MSLWNYCLELPFEYICDLQKWKYLSNIAGCPSRAAIFYHLKGAQCIICPWSMVLTTVLLAWNVLFLTLCICLYLVIKWLDSCFICMCVHVCVVRVCVLRLGDCVFVLFFFSSLIFWSAFVVNKRYIITYCSSFFGCPYRFCDIDACSICRTVDIDVNWHIGFKLYVRKSVDAFRFAVFYCIVVYFLSLSITCWWNKVAQKSRRKKLRPHWLPFTGRATHLIQACADTVSHWSLQY